MDNLKQKHAELPWEVDADAEFIVRACNSYYEMLKALELTAALNQYLTEKECAQDTWRWITEVRNAIKTKVE